MVALGQNAPVHAEDAADQDGYAGSERDHPAAEGRRVLGFDDRVQMVRLDRVVDQTEVSPCAKGAGALLERRNEGARS